MLWLLLFLLLNLTQACDFRLLENQKPITNLKLENRIAASEKKCREICENSYSCLGYGIEGMFCDLFDINILDTIQYEGYDYYVKYDCRRKLKEDTLILESNHWSKQQIVVLVLEVVMYLVVFLSSILIGYCISVLTCFKRSSGDDQPTELVYTEEDYDFT
jgi:hypothetical protein